MKSLHKLGLLFVLATFSVAWFIAHAWLALREGFVSDGSPSLHIEGLFTHHMEVTRQRRMQHYQARQGQDWAPRGARVDVYTYHTHSIMHQTSQRKTVPVQQTPVPTVFRGGTGGRQQEEVPIEQLKREKEAAAEAENYELAAGLKKQIEVLVTRYTEEHELAVRMGDVGRADALRRLLGGVVKVVADEAAGEEELAPPAEFMYQVWERTGERKGLRYDTADFERPIQKLLSPYHLPRIARLHHPVGTCRAALADVINGTQLYTNAAQLKETIESGANNLYAAPNLARRAAERASFVTAQDALEPQVGSLSELQQRFVRDDSHVKLRENVSLRARRPFTISGRSNLVIDFNGAVVNLGENRVYRYLVVVENSRNITLMNGRFEFPNLPGVNVYQKHSDFRTGMVFVHGSREVNIVNCRFTNSPQGTIVATHSRKLWIANNTITNSGAAAVMLHGKTSECVVENNIIHNSTGLANYHAGVVLSYRKVDLREGVGAVLASKLHFNPEHSLLGRVDYPTRNVIRLNKITECSGPGVYLDGAIGNVVQENEIGWASKEGLALDSGATSNVIIDNRIHHCGQRTKQPDFLLEVDVPDNRVGPDGVTIYKVSGISVDNSLYNIIMRNRIEFNFGGGVKFLRTAFYNLVLDNIVFECNKGGSDVLAYPAISLMHDAGDPKLVDSDVAPSIGNMLAYNTIAGKHYIGVLAAHGSTCNEIFLNNITAVYFAVEALSGPDNFVDPQATSLNLATPPASLPDPNWPISSLHFI